MPFPVSPYATVTDYANILNEEEGVEQSRLSNPDAVKADVRKLERQLYVASTEINTYLANRYALPLPVVVPYLTYANVIIAWHNMEIYEEREHVRKRYEDVIKLLKLVALGQSSLTDESGALVEIPPSGVQSGDISYGTGETVFSSESLCGYLDGY